MEPKKSWDDIPSLDGLSVDWDYKAREKVDNRSHSRLDAGSLQQLFETGAIPAKLAIAGETLDARLVDLSKGGAALSLDRSLAIGQPVKTGFLLGPAKILAKGTVRHVKQDGDRYIIGIQFAALNEGSADYIAGLYASKVLF